MDLAQKPVYKLDLAAGTSVVNLTTPLVEGDDRAQTFTLELTDKGVPANLDGYSVTAYFGRGKTAEAEADTIPLSGTVSGNVATITLTESCYSRSCYFSMPIRLSNGATGQKRTYLIVRGTVVKSVDGKIIDPDGSVPSLDELFAQIAVMERTRQAAEEATEEALAAAAKADEAREGIQGDLATLTKDIARNTAPPIVPTATGSIVTITDGAARPAAEVISHIAPVQEGEGDPSPDNVRPISGWNSVTAQRTGRNLFNTYSFQWNDALFSIDADGTVDVNNTSASTMYPFTETQFFPAGTYTISASECPAGALVYFETSATDAYTIVVNAAEKSRTVTIRNAFRARIETAIPSGSSGKLALQVEIGSTATAYEPYQGQTLTADLPETVYGGDKNWSMGLVTVTHEAYVLDGVGTKMTANASAAGDTLFFKNTNGKYKAAKCCDQAPIFNTWPLQSVGCFMDKAGLLFLNLTGTAKKTTDEFNALLAASPVTVICELTTPYTIQLTPQQLETLKGTNNVWSDCGDTTISYVADTQLYIDNKLAAIAAATL